MLPQSVKSVLWSYDTSKIDLQQHKREIITQVLNLGSSEATNWLFRQYSKDEIIREASTTLATNWNKKSLNFWSLILGIRPSLRRNIG